jgi:hypothetical protein
MIKIKGINLSGTLSINKAAFGDELHNKIIAQLSLEDREILNKMVLDAGWYPLDSFVHYLEIMTRDVLKGNEKALQKGTGTVVEAQFKGIYKALLQLGSPRAFVDRISAITNRYYQGITIETEYLDKQKVKATYRGFEKEHRIYEVTILGWWEKVMELLGGKNVQVSLVTSLRENKGYFELIASWE